MVKQRLVILAAVAMAVQPGASSPEERFEATVVKRYDHRNDRILPWGPVASFGCSVGPGQLQYNCSGPIARLMAEALDLSDFQFEKTGPPEYVVTAKLSAPATRHDIDSMLGRFLQEEMGVRYHLEKRSIKAEFLTVTSEDLPKKLAASPDPPPLADASSGSAFRPNQFARQEMGAREAETRVICTNISFHLLAQLLRRYFAVPVVDDTGSTLRFNITFVVRWDPDELKNRPIGTAATPVNLSEIRKLLASYGIGLQSREGSVDFLVVDHVAEESAFLK